VRHAKSSWKDPTLDDFDRPLKKRGKRDAPRMGERLAARGVRPDRIVSSPARRARDTAAAVAAELGWDEGAIELDERIYGASVIALLEIVRDLDDDDAHVMLVGHNPGLTDLANVLTGEEIENVPTAGVVDVTFTAESWRDVAPGGGALVDFDYPKRPV
jgi:phosphohistidine phosphatase